MYNFINAHLSWVLAALVVVAITLLATIYSFSRKRFMDNGPRKGVAAHSAAVTKQNPPDRQSIG